MRTAFQGRFGELVFTVHTIQWATEIPGGCSNKNFALHTAQQHVSMDPRYHETSYTVTTCDTDTLFSPHYFEVLEKAYNEENPAGSSQPVKLCVWQGPLFYNWCPELQLDTPTLAETLSPLKPETLYEAVWDV